MSVCSSWLLASHGWSTVGAQQQARTFRSGTRLIVQAVSVKDGSGNPVGGLTASDFIVTEDGVRQDVSFVEFQRLEHRPDAPPPAVVRAPAGASAPAVVAPGFSAPPGGEIRYRDRRLLILYFDLTALPPADLIRAMAPPGNISANRWRHRISWRS